MVADRYPKNCDDVHGHGCGRVHALDDGDGVEMISVESFVCLSLWYVTIVRSMLSKQFVSVVPCHAYQHFALTQLTSMSAPNFLLQHAV